MARTIDDEPRSYGPLIEAIAKDCAANRKEIAAVGRRVDRTNTLIADLSYQVGTQQRHLALITNDLADMKDVVEATNLRVIKIETEVAGTNKRIDSTNERIDRLELAQVETKSQLNDVQATQMEQGHQLARILAAVEKPGEGESRKHA